MLWHHTVLYLPFGMEVTLPKGLHIYVEFEFAISISLSLLQLN